MFLTYLKGVFTAWAMCSFPSYPNSVVSSNCLSSPSSLIISRSRLIAILKSIWNYAVHIRNWKSPDDNDNDKLKWRGKLPTLLLKAFIGWVCPTRSSSPGVFAYWTSLLLKQKNNADPCEMCGPLSAISRRGDTIRRHAKGHALDSEYVVIRFDAFLLTRKLVCPWEGWDFTAWTFLNSNLDSETHSSYRIGSIFILSIERDFLFFTYITYFNSTVTQDKFNNWVGPSGSDGSQSFSTVTKNV